MNGNDWDMMKWYTGPQKGLKGGSCAALVCQTVTLDDCGVTFKWKYVAWKNLMLKRGEKKSYAQ